MEGRKAVVIAGGLPHRSKKLNLVVTRWVIGCDRLWDQVPHNNRQYLFDFLGSRGRSWRPRIGQEVIFGRSARPGGAKHARNMPGGCFTARKHSGTAAETPPVEGEAGQGAPGRWVG